MSTASIALLGVVTMMAGLYNGIEAFGNEKKRMSKGRQAFANFIISATCMYFLINYR